MAQLNITNKKYSPTGKRFDMDVSYKEMFKPVFTFSLRILSKVVIEEKDIKTMVGQIAISKVDWKPRPNYPNSFTFSLSDFTNAIINPNVKKVKPVVATDNPENPTNNE